MEVNFYKNPLHFLRRLAQVAVVRDGVQAPVQTSAGLVPPHQGREQRHGLHRGELALD